MTWIVWAFILIAQNASTTWASRARNSGSLWYHTLASVFSNGVWFVSFTLLTDSVMTLAKSSASRWQWAGLLVFYTTFTVTGATLMHWFSMRYLEVGKRKVGA